ncbi:MAG: sigma-70 family RNA polymerase sigma factor [Gemmatimonadetes bacterium]|nr:sigma-70 family RNA polymerase sigma factor [Gemmatimonadota bacterium]
MPRSPAPAPDQVKVARLLERLQGGDRDAFDELFPLVYRELHALARNQRRRWEGDHTLNTTGLLHEAYLKLADQAEPRWADRSHFLAVASRAMRHILIDYAKRRRTTKRGAEYEFVAFDDMRDALRVPAGFTPERIQALIALDRSLGRLEAVNPRQSQIVECRFFGGMTIKDTAQALGISPATVKRAWAVAQAWLHRDLRASVDGGVDGSGHREGA